MQDLRNALIIDKERYDESGPSFDMMTILDLIIVIDDFNETFTLMKNRYGPQSTNVSLNYLGLFLSDYKVYASQPSMVEPDQQDDDDLPF